jgi:hypothetical protein
MKAYKILNKLMWSIAGILLVFTACEDDTPARETSPVTADNCQGIYFPVSETINKAVVELEPVEPTEITLTIARTDSTGAIDVPLTVEVNDSSVFVVPETVSFAAGEKETTFTVSFPTAEEGITYNLKLSVSGGQFVNQYATGVPYLATNVTRITWVTPAEPFVYIDGTFLTFYNIEQHPMYVETETATLGDITRYRFKNAYDVATPGEWTNDDYIPEADEYGIYNGYLYNWPGDVDDSKDYYIVIEVDKDGNVSMAPSELGVIWDYGMFSIGSIYGNLTTNEAALAEYPLGTYEEVEGGALITFPANSLYISMANYQNGGEYICGVPTVIYTTKEAYLVANKKIEDFNEVGYEDIDGEVSEFESTAFSESWSQGFQKAIDVDVENEESEYKNLFYLPDLYVSNFGLAFYVKSEGAISIPAGQPTGYKAFGQNIFVSQSEDIDSKKTTNAKGVDVYTFGLKFHYKDGTTLGDFTETFYYSENAVVYAVEDFYGDYTLTGESPFEDGEPPLESVNIAAGSAENTLAITGFAIMGYSYTGSIIATFDPATSLLSIVPQTMDNLLGAYDISLYTLRSNGQTTNSPSYPLSLTRTPGGKVVVSPTSPTIGYLLLSTAAGGWLDGNVYPVFTPEAAAGGASVGSAAAARQEGKVLSKILNTSLAKSAAGSMQKCAKHNFTTGKKAPAKTVKPSAALRTVIK